MQDNESINEVNSVYGHHLNNNQLIFDVGCPRWKGV